MTDAVDRPPVFFPHPQQTLPFSASVRCGDLLFLSGQIGVDANGRLAEGLEAQVDLAIENMRAALQQAGGDLGDLIKTAVMLRDMALWPRFNVAYLRHFDRARLPARSAFGGVQLAFDAELELEGIAYLPRTGFVS